MHDLLPVSCLSFLTQRPMQTLKEKLCTEHLSQSFSQILEYGKYLILEYFLGFFWPHYVAKQWSLFILSRNYLRQTTLVLGPCKPAEFDSRFSSGVRVQSSEGRIKLYIPIFVGCCFAISFSLVYCWFKCFAPLKLSTDVSTLLLVVVACWRLSSRWGFALFCGGEMLK